MENQKVKNIWEFEVKTIDLDKLNYKTVRAALEGGIGDGPAMNDLMIEINDIYYEELEEFFYPWELSLDQRGFLARIPLKTGGTMLEFIESK